MTDPWKVLDLPPGAAETAIRQRYLDLVQQYPPEREPQRFAEVRAAYDTLRDPVRRLEEELFRLEPTVSIDGILRRIHEECRKRRIPTRDLLALAGD